MTFAQDTPFQVEVVVSVARMRWGPGPTFVVQHYANAGHALTVLEVDSTSNPPWTWYYARTPSNVVAWIRADLVRLATGAAAVVPQVENPTGTYPVAFDNLCNTAIFRSCQDGTDFLLWQAGYWAFDRYEHWERGGWNLDVVYHQNPCKLDRLCSTKEEWDAGRLEAQVLAVTPTPEVTLTPFVVTVVSTKEVPVVWTKVDGIPAFSPLVATALLAPTNIEESGNIVGRIRFRSESVKVTCQYWHNVGQDPDADYVKSSVKRVTNFDDDEYQEQCRGGLDEGGIVARHWVITLTRRYNTGFGVSDFSWKLTATFGDDEPTECDNTPSSCAKILSDPVLDYLQDVKADPADNKEVDDVDERALTAPLGISSSGSCDTRYNRQGKEGKEVTRYEFTCTTAGHTLEVKYTHDQRPEPVKLTPTATATQ